MANKRDEDRKRIDYGDDKESASRQLAGMESGAYRIPDGVKVIQIKSEKVLKGDLLPYIVTKGRGVKGGNPDQDTGKAFHHRTFQVHRFIGAEGKTYCCLRMWGEACPICEERMSLLRKRSSNEDDKAYVATLKPKDRDLWIFRNRDEDNKIQLIEESFYTFGKKILHKVASSDDEYDYRGFARLDKGQTVKITFTENKSPKGTFYEASTVEMRPRSSPLPDSLFDEVPDLDCLLIKTPYEKLKMRLGLGPGDLFVLLPGPARTTTGMTTSPR